MPKRLAILAASVVLAAAAALPAAADEPAPEPASDAGFVGQCLDAHLSGGAAGAERACVGLIAYACMNRPEGRSTIGQSACLLREAAAWEILMRESLATLGERVLAHDAASSAGEAAPALDRAQAAWADYAEAECAYAYALWGEGSFRQVAGADCRLNVMARRAIQLRAQIGFES
jgi:uncharacterized protein YecT (DUF1311 family)